MDALYSTLLTTPDIVYQKPPAVEIWHGSRDFNSLSFVIKRAMLLDL